MNQILHIFRKDARRHWPEIAISLSLLLAFAWREPRNWRSQSTIEPLSQFLSGALAVLVPVAWSFLIVRIVHAESLVGDRQFWITRPYQWKKLLAAKILFLAVFMNAPLLIADVILLAKAGFSPTRHLPGLLYMQLLMTVFLFLPSSALASVTANISQVLLAVLGIVLYLIGVAALSSEIPNSQISSADLIPGSIEFAILIAVLLVTVVLQYARRESFRSRVLLIGAALSILVIMVVTPYGTIIAHIYQPPASAQEQPVQLSFDSAKTPKPLKQRFPIRENEDAYIHIPLLVSGMAKDSLVAVDGTRFTVDSSGGAKWSSNWRPGGLLLTPDKDHDDASLQIGKRFLEMIGASPANVHISFALTVFREASVRKVIVAAGDFAVPDVGLCRMTASEWSSILCRSPLRRPSYLKVSTSSSESPCPHSEGEKPSPAGKIWNAWEWSSESGPAELGISPMQVFSLQFWERNDAGELTSPRFCQGAPLTFTTFERVRQTRADLDISGIKLSDYRLLVP